MKAIKILILLIITGCCWDISAQSVISRSAKFRPKWVNSSASIPKYNQTYEYKLVKDSGPSLDYLEANRRAALGSYLQSVNKIDGIIDTQYEELNTDKESSSHSSYKISFQTQTTVEDFTCVLIDDYSEQVTIPGVGLRHNYYTLYAVSKPGIQPLFDDYSLEDKYGARGLWRSAIVPGWGQFHKGSYLKGGLILGGTVVLVGGIIFTENQRTDYVSKIAKTHDANIKKAYATKRDHFATGRNICIGAVAALYVYNLIDAIVAPGARRVVVQKRPNGSTYAFTPAILDGNAPGMAVAMTF